MIGAEMATLYRENHGRPCLLASRV